MSKKQAQFSYNAALLAHGSAFMANYTTGATKDKWTKRTENLVKRIFEFFYAEGAHVEVPCEGHRGCTTDMFTFKGYTHRWLSVVSQLVPSTKASILPMLKKSAEAAVRQCTGGETGRQCGFYWSKGEFIDPNTDGTTGAGEAMSVLAAVASLLIEDAPGPAVNQTGISKGDNNAGVNSKGPKLGDFKPIDGGDRAGAVIITVLLLGVGVSTWAWMSFRD